MFLINLNFDITLIYRLLQNQFAVEKEIVTNIITVIDNSTVIITNTVTITVTVTGIATATITNRVT